jgi:hypothetical protein
MENSSKDCDQLEVTEHRSVTSPRLPAKPLLRCLLAFTLGSFFLFGVGVVTAVFQLQRGGWLLAADQAEVQVAQADSAIDAYAEAARPLEKETKGSAEKNTVVGKQISAIVARHSEQTSGENLKELDRMSKQLDSITSDKAVDDVASSLRKWMGLGARASKPKARGNVPVDDFDIDSAQLHEVQRTEIKPKKFEFHAVLIDANGKTIKIKMTEHEGNETYALMQRIKANPLLEKIYRQIAMPLLDTLVESARDQMKTSSSSTQKAEK